MRCTHEIGELTGGVTSRRLVLRCALMLGGVLAAGCEPKTGTAENGDVKKPGANTPTAQISNTDECAERMHDICGAFLEYYRQNHQLPPRLDALKQIPAFSFLELTCPVSKLSYVYNPIGIITPDNQPRMICYDAAPSHSGMRWTIQFVEPQGNRAPVMKVVAVRESGFTLQPPR